MRTKFMGTKRPFINTYIYAQNQGYKNDFMQNRQYTNGQYNFLTIYSAIFTRLKKNIKNVKGCRDGMPKSMPTR